MGGLTLDYSKEIVRKVVDFSWEKGAVLSVNDRYDWKDCLTA